MGKPRTPGEIFVCLFLVLSYYDLVQPGLALNLLVVENDCKLILLPQRVSVHHTWLSVLESKHEEEPSGEFAME